VHRFALPGCGECHFLNQLVGHYFASAHKRRDVVHLVDINRSDKSFARGLASTGPTSPKTSRSIPHHPAARSRRTQALVGLLHELALAGRHRDPAPAEPRIKLIDLVRRRNRELVGECANAGSLRVFSSKCSNLMPR